ncbi:hypothetical protein BH23ACT11_BH23ACT11_05160 [soil metagenome]
MDAATNSPNGQHPIQSQTSYTLAKVCRAHRGIVGAFLAELGLHVGQEMVLIELWEQDGLRSGELASRLGVEPPTATRMVQRLENGRIVRRQQDPEDARSFRVYLTDAGRSLEEPVTRRWELVEERLLAGLSHEERRSFYRILFKVRAGLDPGFEGC